jgi:ABC-type polysaccharide/polyol phosphate export permease
MSPGAVPVRAPTGASLGGLVWTLVRTDFKSRYHGTLAGFLWALLKPISMFLVLMSVFSFIFVNDPHYRLNLILGLFLWDYFVEATRVGIASLAAKSFLVTKTRTPIWAIVAASGSNAALTLAVFSVALVGFLLAAGRPVTLAGLGLYLCYLLLYWAIVLGIVLAGSVLFLRYRDLNQVWEVATQAGFFVVPIIYPLGILPERVHAYLYLWPPTPIIQFSRAVLIEGGVPTGRAHALLALGAGLILAVGMLVFRRYAPRAAEYL